MQIKKENIPLVSVIIPIFNGENYMREAIDSALAQTYENIEVIVVNDGSTDDTDEIAKSYGGKIRYFIKENGGVSSALNLALREMNGEYFSWLSHDDIYYPDKIEKQTNFLLSLKNKEVILYSNCELIDGSSNHKINMIFDHNMLSLKPEYALLRGSINGCTLLVPKEAFCRCGLFDEKLKCTQDYAKWFEMMKIYEFVHMPEILVKHRIHHLQDTNTSPFFLKEGNELWINMMMNLSVDDKIRLEGNEFKFYKEMRKFLEKTKYLEALKFSEKLMFEKASKSQKIRIIISNFIRNKTGFDFDKKIENLINFIIGLKKKYIKKVFVK